MSNMVFSKSQIVRAGVLAVLPWLSLKTHLLRLKYWDYALGGKGKKCSLEHLAMDSFSKYDYFRF